MTENEQKQIFDLWIGEHKNLLFKVLRAYAFTSHALLMMFGLALLMIIEGILDNELYQIPEGIILIFAGGYVYWQRRNRIKYEGLSDRSLLGDLEQSIRAVEYHIRRQRNFLWWFILPILCTVLIHFAFTFNRKPWWLWLVAAGYFIFVHWHVQKEVNCKFLPQKNDLESLKRLLLEGEPPAK